MLHLLAYRVVVGWNTSTAKTISHAYTVGCGHVFSFPITGFKFWMTLLLFPPPPVLLFDFTQLFSDLFLPLYLQKFKDKVTERTRHSSAYTPTLAPSFSIYLPFCLLGDMEVILSGCPLIGTVKHCAVSVLFRSERVWSSGPR